MSNNLALAQGAPSQNNKETTIDDQAGQLDAGLTDKVDVALTGTSAALLRAARAEASATSRALPSPLPYAAGGHLLQPVVADPGPLQHGW